MQLNSYFKPRYIFWLLLLASVFSLGMAYAFEYGLELYPCILCVYQRIPFLVLIVISSIALLSKSEYKIFLSLSMLTALINSGIAFFHSGVERGWWQMTEACDAPIPSANLQELQTFLMTQVLGRCDQIPWSFLGLSMANYNVVFCLGLAIVCMLGLYYEQKSHINIEV